MQKDLDALIGMAEKTGMRYNIDRDTEDEKIFVELFSKLENEGSLVFIFDLDGTILDTD